MEETAGPRDPANKLRQVGRTIMAGNMMRSFRDLGGFSDDYETYTASEQSLKLSVAAILSYLFLGTLSFKLWMDDWTVIDAMYFTTTTFTTVGYGDLSPASSGQRIWGIVFVVLGVIILGGIALSIIFDRLFSLYEDVSKELELSQNMHYLNLFSGNMFHEDPKQKKTLCQEMLYQFFRSLILVMGLVIPALAIGYLEGWTIVDSLYYCAMTATTVGYGDISPQRQETRLIAVFYLPLCVGVMAKILGKFSSIYMKRKAQETERDFLNRELTVKDIKHMSGEGDSSVSYNEFLTFMLVTMGKVERTDIEQLERLYQKLDRDHNGSLEVQDLISKANGHSIA